MKLRAQKVEHRNWKREVEVRGPSNFEKGAPGCASAHCMSKRFGLKTKLAEFTPKETTPTRAVGTVGRLKSKEIMGNN